MLDDTHSDNWNEHKMNGEKVSLYDDKLVFRDTGVVFTLQGDILSMITDYDFKKPESPDAKQIIFFWMKCILRHVEQVKVKEIEIS